MNKQYIDACENFKWLQEELGGGRGDQCKCEIKKEKGKHCMLWWAVPRLDTLIELLGDRFISLEHFMKGDKEGRETLCWYCAAFTDKHFIMSCYEEAETPELACITALKKVEGE